MGSTYTRQSSTEIVDGEVIQASDFNNEFEQLVSAFAVSTGHSHDGTTAEGGPVTKLLGTAITIGDGTVGTDIAVTFDGETSDGVLTWMEDEDHFKFSDDVVIDSSKRIYLYDEGGEYIYGDGTDLYLVAGADINIPADVGVTFGNDGEKIEGDGTDLTISASALFNVDAGTDIVLDAGGGDVFFKDDGTTFGSATNTSGNLIIKSGTTTALTFSGANATLAGDLTISGDDLTMGTNTSGAALIADGTNFNPVVISGDISISTAGVAAIGSGVIVAADIASSAVTTAKINADAVTGAKIADDAIDSEHYTDGSIDTAHLANDAITGAKIADDALDSEHYTDGSIDSVHLAADVITGAKIADDAIDSEHYTDGSIDNAHIADDAIDSEHYADGSIDTAHLAADVITGAKIADDAIDSEHYTDGSIDTAHLANDAVTGAKIADDAIDSEHYTNASIDTAHYAAGSVDTTALGADAVTAAKIADDAIDSEHYTDGSIDTAHLAADAVTGAKIADDAIDSEHYTDGSIDNAHIADDAIDSEHYAAGSIDTAHIADLQVTTAKIAADAITSAKIADDAIDSEHYTDGSIDNAHIADDAIDSEHYAAGSIDTAHIADNQVTLAKMAGLARGKLIYGDASGDPAALTAGDADQVLTSDGTDISWADAAGGSSTVGLQSFYLGAGSLIPRVTNGPSAAIAELGTNDVMVHTLDFATGTEEGAGIHHAMPDKWNKGVITARFHWTAASGSGGVVWSLGGVAMSNDDPLDVARGTAIAVADTFIAANDHHASGSTGNITVAGSPADGDLIYLEVKRVVANGSDTLGVDAKLLGVTVFFTTDAAVDG